MSHTHEFDSPTGYALYLYPPPYKNPNRAPGIRRDRCARFQIQCVSKAELVDGETVTIYDIDGDGSYSAVEFEWDVDGLGAVGAGIAVDVSALTTAAECAGALYLEMLSSGLNISSWQSAGTGGLLDWYHMYPGYLSTPSETVADADFTVTAIDNGLPASSLFPARFGPVRAILPVDYASSQD